MAKKEAPYRKSVKIKVPSQNLIIDSKRKNLVLEDQELELLLVIK